MVNETDTTTVNKRKFKRIINISEKNWERISFNDFGFRYSEDYTLAKKKVNNIIMEELVFTKVYDEFNGRIITHEHIWNGETPVPVIAGWDTGSTYSCISPEFADQLNLQPINTDNLHTAHGIHHSKIYEIDIFINKQFTYTVCVMENPNIHAENVDLLIGMDIISEGDFAISTYKDKTCFSFRIPSKGHIDFTK